MPNLTSTTEITVRYKEADPMGVVWHGHYIQYFEDGREAFGEKFHIGYKQIEAYGLTIPVVSIQCNYKASLRYGDKAIVEVTYIDCSAPKIEFEYKIYRSSDNIVCAIGKSTQVYLNTKRELLLLVPECILQWKKKNGLLL
jgi:acyl-CoA thioester hydrolase